MRRLMIVALVATLPACAGISSSVKSFAHDMGAKVCETKEQVVGAGKAAAGGVLPPFLVEPVAGVIDLGLTAICETFKLGTVVTGEVVGGAVDPIGTVSEIVSPTPATEATPPAGAEPAGAAGGHGDHAGGSLPGG